LFGLDSARLDQKIKSWCHRDLLKLLHELLAFLAAFST
jgi:hypothetical protein